MKTEARPLGALLIASSAVVLLGGCQWLDTRPEVTITPAGDLTAHEFLDIQVDAGGAPEVQILLDGRLWGSPIPAGKLVHLDVRALLKGNHELVARVEKGTSPRVSQPRKLIRVLSEPDLILRSTVENDPWKLFAIEFTADVPLSDVAVEVTGPDRTAIPFTQRVGPDRKSVVVNARSSSSGP
jgi:hypothetical protein